MVFRGAVSVRRSARCMMMAAVLLYVIITRTRCDLGVVGCANRLLATA